MTTVERGLERADRWVVVLAGGDGVRLRPLTRRLAGDERPKQFCSVLEGGTLLEQTWSRARLLAPRGIMAVVTRSHERYYESALANLGARHVVAQPDNRGTAAGTLYPLLRLAALDRDATVAFLPSDHYVSDDERFMAQVRLAFDHVERPAAGMPAAPRDEVVLLGITPDTHETEYGWIEPGALMSGARPLYRVRRFWEKPDPALAAMLRERGCFWNSFVMVGRVAAFEALVADALPDLAGAFEALRPMLGGPGEVEAVRALYARLVPRDFSREILSRRPGRLALLPVRGVVWSDLGSPERVQATRERMDRQAVALAS